MVQRLMQRRTQRLEAGTQASQRLPARRSGRSVYHIGYRRRPVGAGADAPSADDPRTATYEEDLANAREAVRNEVAIWQGQLFDAGGGAETRAAMEDARRNWDHVGYIKVIAAKYPLIAEELAELSIMMVSNAPVESVLSHAGRVDAERRTRLSQEMAEAMTGGIVRKAEFAECLATTVELWCLGAAGWDVDEADESELSVLDGLPMEDEGSDHPCPGPEDHWLADADDDGEAFPSMRGEDDAFPRLPPREE